MSTPKEIKTKNLRPNDLFTVLSRKDNETSYIGDIFRVITVQGPFVYAERNNVYTKKWEKETILDTRVRKLMRLNKNILKFTIK